MGIKLEETKIIKSEWNLKSVQMYKRLNPFITNKEDWVSYILFEKKDEGGSVIDSFTKNYEGASFDTFWKDFNNIQFIYDQLTDELGLPPVVDPKIEDEIKNVKLEAVPVDIDPVADGEIK